MVSSRLLAIAAIGLIAAGCGGTKTATQAHAPAWRSLGSPEGYRVERVWHANLSGGPVRDVVVDSVGPRVTSIGGLHARSRDLRVLMWNRRADRWAVAFDAQRVMPPHGNPTSMLDPHADVSFGPVRFVHLLSSRDRDQLVFSASNNYFGSGTPMVLAVLDLEGGHAKFAYSWNGEILRGWHVAHGRLYATAAYWTENEPHCCPLRLYRFAIAPRRGALSEVSDDRPWLGVKFERWNRPLKVIGIDPRSPALGRLRVGDVLLKVLNAPRLPYRKQPWTMVFDRIGLFRPGQVAQLLVDRDGQKIRIDVKLGSKMDAPVDLLRFDI
jgi:hypothetical protein